MERGLRPRAFFLSPLTLSHGREGIRGGVKRRVRAVAAFVASWTGGRGRTGFQLSLE